MMMMVMMMKDDVFKITDTFGETVEQLVAHVKPAKSHLLAVGVLHCILIVSESVICLLVKAYISIRCMHNIQKLHSQDYNLFPHFIFRLLALVSIGFIFSWIMCPIFDHLDS